MTENEYTDIMRVVAHANPMLERWARRYGGRDWFNYQERLRIALSDHLCSTLSSMKEIPEFIY